MRFIPGYRWWLAIAAGLFLASLGAGLTAPELTASVLGEELAGLRRLGEMLAGQPPIIIAAVLFARNALTLFTSFLLGPVLLLMPMVSLIANGLLLGSVAALVSQQRSLGFMLSGLLPHGIVELPAFIMGEAAALGFGATAIASLFRKEKKAFLLSGLRRNLRYMVIAVVLLLPAAVIEAFVTPQLLR